MDGDASVSAGERGFRRLLRDESGQAAWTIVAIMGVLALLTGSTALVAWSEVYSATSQVSQAATAALREAMDEQALCDSGAAGESLSLNPPALASEFEIAYTELVTRGTLPQPSSNACNLAGQSPGSMWTTTLPNLPSPAGSSVMTASVGATVTVYAPGAQSPVAGETISVPTVYVDMQVPVAVFAFGHGGFVYTAHLYGSVVATPAGVPLYGQEPSIFGATTPGA